MRAETKPWISPSGPLVIMAPARQAIAQRPTRPETPAIVIIVALERESITALLDSLATALVLMLVFILYPLYFDFAAVLVCLAFVFLILLEPCQHAQLRNSKEIQTKAFGHPARMAGNLAIMTQNNYHSDLSSRDNMRGEL